VLGLLAAAMTLWGADIGLFPLWVGLAGVLAVHRRCHLDPAAPRRPANPSGGAPLSPLSTPGARGWGHRRTLLRAYLLMAAAARARIAAPRHAGAGAMAAAAGWAAIYWLIHVRVGLAERLAAPIGHDVR
jgi:hypothetical protein